MVGDVFRMVAVAGSLAVAGMAAAEPIPVNVTNFVRVETDKQIERALALAGGVNRFAHNRAPTPIDQQNVIRMNRDTLYSFAVVDISAGATVTLPETGGRYMTAMIVNQDHYINAVLATPGPHRLDMATHGTPYVVVAVRTLVDASDPADIAAANALQDRILIDAASANPFEMPAYDEASYKDNLEALLGLSKHLPGSRGAFGRRDEVDPIVHLLGTAFGWGGLPETEAIYLNVEPGLPVGKYRITAKDVPVGAFWSVTVYDKSGFMQKNDVDRYNVNSISGRKNPDGSMTVHLGGCEDGRANCIPLTEGWNYIVRLYRPGPEILAGTFQFPAAQPAD